MELSDRELLELMRQGSEKALVALQKRYGKAMFITATKRLGNTEDAEELVMDIFYNLWKLRARLELQLDDLRGYLTKALANRIFRTLYEQSRMRLKENEYQPPRDQTAASPEQEFLRKELQNRVEAAIRRLPEQCRLVFRLHHEQDLNRKEIAAALSISENTVKYHLKRANADIKQTLGKMTALLPLFSDPGYLLLILKNLYKNS